MQGITNQILQTQHTIFFYATPHLSKSTHYIFRCSYLFKVSTFVDTSIMIFSIFIRKISNRHSREDRNNSKIY